MSIGNNKSNGNKGNNFPYQAKVLTGLQQALELMGPLGKETTLAQLLQDFNAEDFATEATLQSVLAAIQNGSDYEAKLVVDNNGATWLEVRIWNPDTSTFDAPVYYAAGSNTAGTPATPINYINPLTLLATVANNTTGLSTEATLELVRLLLVSLDGKDFATQTTLASVDTKLNVATRVPNLLRVTGAGTIAPAVYDFSVYNAGDNDGTILGGTIKSKEALNFSAGGLNHIYGAGTISYDGTGTELVIIYNS